MSDNLSKRLYLWYYLHPRIKKIFCCNKASSIRHGTLLSFSIWIMLVILNKSGSIFGDSFTMTFFAYSFTIDFSRLMLLNVNKWVEPAKKITIFFSLCDCKLAFTRGKIRTRG